LRSDHHKCTQLQCGAALSPLARFANQPSRFLLVWPDRSDRGNSHFYTAILVVGLYIDTEDAYKTSGAVANHYDFVYGGIWVLEPLILCWRGIHGDLDFYGKCLQLDPGCEDNTTFGVAFSRGLFHYGSRLFLHFLL
jgi:hypothetical protein